MPSLRQLIAVAVLAVAASGIALAETAPGQHPMPMGARPGMHAGSEPPTMPGQDAFGAIQEIVGILEADPKTDWSKVDLEALRQHLIDMNEVTLKADAAATPIDGGLAVEVTGSERTLAAIRRMIPAHAMPRCWASSPNAMRSAASWLREGIRWQRHWPRS